MVLPEPVKKLVSEFERLPGIGFKSASRLTYYLLSVSEERSVRLGDALINLKRNMKICSECFNISETEVCEICLDPSRIKTQICVLEEPFDLFAVEKVSLFKGCYHVLGGVISPLFGVSPDDLRIKELRSRVSELRKKYKTDPIEVIVATNPTLEGESTCYYILDALREIEGITVSRIARGIPTGGHIEYADSTTLKNSIENRVELKE